MFKRIIHIAQDEKLPPSAYFQFESIFPKKNLFYIVNDSLESEFTHVKKQESVFKISSLELNSLVKDIQDTDLVIFHSLAPHFYSFVMKLPKNVKTIWFCFGAEVYNDVRYFSIKKNFDKLTRRKYPSKKTSITKKIKDLFRPFFRFFKNDIDYSNREIKEKVFNRINYLGSSFEEEFKMIQKLIKKKKPFFSFWYYPLEQIVSVSEGVKNDRGDILIGNSGHKTGNHIDVFERIKKMGIIDRKIIVPLSYGNTDYIKNIVNEGDKLFACHFQPLLEFLPIKEYNNKIASCGVAIFNNKRQQAIGNTIAIIWLGSKVFLSNKNPFYHYLKRIGIFVFCYETELTEKSCNEFLSLEQMEHNRKVLYEHLNQKKLLIELQNQLNNIFD